MAKKPEQIIKELKKLHPNVEWLPIDQVHENPDNPRFISEEDLQGLMQSIIDLPEMMPLRPGVIDESGILQSANQRKKACVALGWKEFPVIRANGMTREQLKEFMIKDNLSAGSWDTDTLFKDWDLKNLEEWNFPTDLLDVRPPELDNISDQPKGTGNVKHQKTLHLKFTEKQYNIVIKKLKAISETPEDAIWKLLHPNKK